MERDVASILGEALALRTENRAALAQSLLVRLHPNAEDSKLAWAAEIDRRIAEFASGTVTAILSPEAWRRLSQLGSRSRAQAVATAAPLCVDRLLPQRVCIESIHCGYRLARARVDS